MDAAGNAYVTGDTELDATSRRRRRRPDDSTAARDDAFVAKLNAGRHRRWSTPPTSAAAATTSAAASPWTPPATPTSPGGTDSTNFPTTPGAFDTGFNGITDAFVAKFAENPFTVLGRPLRGNRRPPLHRRCRLLRRQPRPRPRQQLYRLRRLGRWQQLLRHRPALRGRLQRDRLPRLCPRGRLPRHRHPAHRRWPNDHRQQLRHVADAPLRGVGKTLAFTEGALAGRVVASFQGVADPGPATPACTRPPSTGATAPDHARTVSAERRRLQRHRPARLRDLRGHLVTVAIQDAGGASTVVLTPPWWITRPWPGRRAASACFGNKNFSGIVGLHRPAAGTPPVTGPPSTWPTPIPAASAPSPAAPVHRHRQPPFALPGDATCGRRRGPGLARPQYDPQPGRRPAGPDCASPVR